jgi:hypothetical protein
MDPDDREFMRELLLRHEKASDAMVARLNQATDESRLRTEQIRAGMYDLSDQIRAHTREFVAEMQAQRQALFRMIDRLDGQGA